jgi:hypothetical protein
MVVLTGGMTKHDVESLEPPQPAFERSAEYARCVLRFGAALKNGIDRKLLRARAWRSVRCDNLRLPFDNTREKDKIP